MSACNHWPSRAGEYTELWPQIQRLQSHVTEDKLYWVYPAPDEDPAREHSNGAGALSDRVAVVRRLIHPELAEPSSPRESWMAFSKLMAEPSAQARFPSVSCRDFQAGRIV
jgi:hypothetical protein